MFIRKRDHTKPLADILLVVFLFASAFTHSSGMLSSYLIEALGYNFEKSEQTKPSTYQFPCEGTEKEAKAEYKLMPVSFQADGVHFDLDGRQVRDLYAEPTIPDRTSSPLFLFNRSLRL